MLKEGREYLFIAEKEINTPDNKKHWVLKGPDNKKYLIPSSYYYDYGIIPGFKIMCRVDKINCQGKIYLEPRHPAYKEGEKYEFVISSFAIRTDISGNEEKIMIVKDLFGNEIPAPFPENSTPALYTGSKVILKVEKIYKGKPVFFQNSSPAGHFAGLRYGNTYKFFAEKIIKDIEGKEIIVARDPVGKIHTIPYKYYKHYKIFPGKFFRGRIIKHSRNGPWKIEPENPFYKKDQTLTLRIKSTSKVPSENSFILRLIDEFGFTHTVLTSKIPENDSVICRVLKIRKGQPLLALL